MYDFGPGGKGFAGRYDDWKCEDGDDPGHGPQATSLLHCTCCPWQGDFTGAVEHFRLFDHPLTYHGTIQDFSRYAVTREELLDRR